MRPMYLGAAMLSLMTGGVHAADDAVCQFLPQSDMPKWVNQDIRDDDFYYAVGGASGKSGSSYVPINTFINNAREDAVANLSNSIRSSIKVSTKRTIESKKSNKSKAEVRKEVKQKTEVVSQVALAAVIDDAKWLDTKQCLLWYRVKVSKAGAEFAVKAYVDEVSERLHKKIEQLTHREIEQILSDNGFSPTLESAVQSLLNNSQAYYRGQVYDVAELYQQSGFDWINESDNSFFMRSIWGNNSPITRFDYLYYQNNAVTSVVRSSSSLSKQIHALTQLKSFGVDLNDVRISAGQYFPNGGTDTYISKKTNSLFSEHDDAIYRATREATLGGTLKTPLIYNFTTNSKKESLGLLHFAVISHRADLIQPLLSLGVDINQKTTLGYTSLALAVEYGQLSFAQQLLKLGVNPKEQDYIAYKIAYLLQHLNTPDLYSAEFSVPSAMNLPLLEKVMSEMELNAREVNKVKKMILKKYPVNLTVTTVKMSDDLYNYDYDNIEKQVFLNGKEVK
ncbi:ankyrin repeat domain-containing protein [Vibrio tapetis]|uniref:Uncharacterized protein n=1 Tax=Vibrio tapetis subsp. tapetis TaxID=1671868 RepID=A0A2N8ZMD2_9VIBR|nr:ankyrin repeat domain-containing protein [Vibrio tapetis]SON53037.1 exported protein of unknown function [Vibrio tapetis subsp. tapetis]